MAKKPQTKEEADKGLESEALFNAKCIAYGLFHRGFSITRVQRVFRAAIMEAKQRSEQFFEAHHNKTSNK